MYDIIDIQSEIMQPFKRVLFVDEKSFENQFTSASLLHTKQF